MSLLINQRMKGAAWGDDDDVPVSPGASSPVPEEHVTFVPDVLGKVEPGTFLGTVSRRLRSNTALPAAFATAPATMRRRSKLCSPLEAELHNLRPGNAATLQHGNGSRRYRQPGGPPSWLLPRLSGPPPGTASAAPASQVLTRFLA